MLLSLVEIDANALVPRHTHPHEQVGIVVEGGMELGIDGEVQVHQVGDMHIIPGGVKHYARGLDQPCRALDVFSPVREEFKY